MKENINSIILFSKNKLEYYKELLRKTTNVYYYYNKIGVINNTKITHIITEIDKLVVKLNDTKIIKNNESIVNQLQEINDSFSLLFKQYGTYHLQDLLIILYGKNYHSLFKEDELERYAMINNYCLPIQYKIVDWKDNTSPTNKDTNIDKNSLLNEYDMIENYKTLECFDLGRKDNSFILKMYGLRVIIHNNIERNTLIIDAIVENHIFGLITDSFIQDKIEKLYTYFREKEENDIEFLIHSITLKELIIYECDEIYRKIKGYISYSNYIYNKEINTIIREFMNENTYNKRKMICSLLLSPNKKEYNHIAYLLYDLLTKDDEKEYSLEEQSIIYHSLPHNLKKKFHLVMKDTIQYTNHLLYTENMNVPLERQIILLKTDENTKQKAMSKLREVKSKSEDGATKARQYLEGLLKIPFGTYKRETILTKMDTLKINFSSLIDIIHRNDIMDISHYQGKGSYNNIQIQYLLNIITKEIQEREIHYIENYLQNVENENRPCMVFLCKLINLFVKENKLEYPHIYHSNQKKAYLYTNIKWFVLYLKDNDVLLDKFLRFYNVRIKVPFKKVQLYPSFIQDIKNSISKIEREQDEIGSYISTIRKTLDKSIYGHEKAKRQLERIIGQWITGKQTGYCFGFEGPPGVGKTSLAKHGLSKCLKDKDNNCRPFGFIALGGSSNGSTLQGHNYTYLGSTWGRIVDILMESKCMNPIIFIDELDKVSNTEHGKEIIGILTHLVDSTQNTQFQDKYFNGVHIDLSKALIIFSYNDRSKIDRILLDRIHEIKFSSLTLREKIVIVNDYILPELYEIIDLKDTIEIPENVLVYLIDHYTNESGVRKLKELLYEIISEINLEILERKRVIEQEKIELTIDNIKKKYLKDYKPVYNKKIHHTNEIGIINGLWASAIGQGGIIPIQSRFHPSSSFLDLTLTGMQGDVMKESMNVAKTLAYNKTPKSRIDKLYKLLEDNNKKGIHIHCPEGSVPKDGPSAGVAITLSIYSLLNEIPIKNDIAITGEINLQGQITMIGGLELKVLGGIKAGIKKFIYPKDNEEDIEEIFKKHHIEQFKDITFHPVSVFEEALNLVFTKE